ncbi:hypothetical protein ABH926_005338 [Catenulispora sp. GP43]|uniref:hypothetical protein n=1 Tax=Catenulispora sp. GP43 TaxID=3156263 RepID=UPI003512CB8E
MATIGLVPRTGLGMAASRLSQAGRAARVTEALYCPPAVRDDPALAVAVQQRVDEWAAGVRLAPGPTAGLGRLAVLAHPDTDDVDRLAVAARLLAVGRVLAAGALEAEEEDLLLRPAAAPVPGGAGAGGAAGAAGAVPEPGVAGIAVPATGMLGGAAANLRGGGLPVPDSPGLPAAETAADAADAAGTLTEALASAAAEIHDGCDVPDHALASRPDPSRAGIADPALLSALAGLSALPASPYQVQRVRAECEALSSASGGGAGAGAGPRAPWEYLSLGHVNAYSPALAALDAVDGFELSPSAAADPELRRAQRLAALAAALLHDIASPVPSGLTAAIARADGLAPGAAGRRAAQVHDEAMRAFQHHATQLAGSADPATRRYLSGLWTWLGGHRTWHAVS